MSPSADPRGQKLSKLAGKQGSVVLISQLCDLGYTRAEIRRMVAEGFLHRIHRGVYAVGHRRIGRDGYLWAAYLAAGDTAFFSHRTAGGILQICGLNTYQIELTIVADHTRRPNGYTLHRCREQPHRHELTTRSNWRVSSATGVLLQLAPTETDDELATLVERADRRNLLDRDKLEAAFTRHPRRPGIVALKRALADYRPRPFDKSGLERAIAAEIAKDPEIPPPQRNVPHPRWELDFYWADLELVVEADGGPYHKTPDDIRRDKLKDAKLATVGIQVVRVPDDRWELDQAGVMADLRAIVARRRNDLRAA